MSIVKRIMKTGVSYTDAGVRAGIIYFRSERRFSVGQIEEVVKQAKKYRLIYQGPSSDSAHEVRVDRDRWLMNADGPGSHSIVVTTEQILSGEFVQLGRANSLLWRLNLRLWASYWDSHRRPKLLKRDGGVLTHHPAIMRKLENLITIA